MENEKKQFNIISLIISLIGITVGLLLILLDGNTLTTVVFIILGIVIILLNLSPFIQSCKDLKYRTPIAYSQFITSLLTIVLGAVMIFFHDALTWIFGIILLVINLIKIILAKEQWVDEFFRLLPLTIFAILILVIGIGGIVNIFLTVVGWIILILSIIYLLFSIYNFFKKS